MTLKLQIITFLIAVFIIVIVFVLIRSKKLKVIYSIFWLFSSFVLLIFTIWGNFVNIIADIFGIDYAPSLLLLIGFLLGGMIILHLTIIISQQSKLIKELYEEFSILKLNIQKLRKQTKQETNFKKVV